MANKADADNRSDRAMSRTNPTDAGAKPRATCEQCVGPLLDATALATGICRLCRIDPRED